MFWSFFLKCSKKKSSKYKVSKKSAELNDVKQIVKDILLNLKEENPSEVNLRGSMTLQDNSFNILSVVDPYHDFINSFLNESEEEDLIQEDEPTTMANEVHVMENIESNLLSINSNYKQNIKHRLKSLECPFTWHLEPNKWNHDIIYRIENKYGFIGMDISTADFSIEKYVSNLIVSCVLFKVNEPDRSFKKIMEIWKWLDNIDHCGDQFYLNIRDGLKHIVMSTLAFMFYNSRQITECQRLHHMITPFNNLSTKARAAVYCIQAAICIEYGGDALEKATESAKIACELDSDTAYWHYVYSLTLSAQRQFLKTNKSCPTEAEFNAIQYAIILLNREQNPYFYFHRMHLMITKTLFHQHLNNNDDNITDELMSKIKKDFQNIAELIKAILDIKPEDPHLLIRCARSLMVLPVEVRGNNSVKDILLKALDISKNDPTVIRAIKKSLDVYKKINKKRTIPENIFTESDTIQNELSEIVQNEIDEFNLKECLKSAIEKHNNGRDPVVDLFNILTECRNEDDKWKILAQICSYTIIWKGPSFLRTSVEQFIMLIQNEGNASKEFITQHFSIFAQDTDKTFNLAELLCNEIKLVILFGGAKDSKDIQFYLNQLTKIIEICKIKSQEADPTLRSRLLKDLKQIEENTKPKLNGYRQNVNKNLNRRPHHNKNRRGKKMVYKNPTSVFSYNSNISHKYRK
ncbi:uncharacterized protein LOC126906699 [Daktulosphaira vitifoliae]|uniref:uncharacterized protein LOC126906699 n=1 Tax=Daktulosphaira vitifoliae TaxID=58002 RepID=UPI0021AA70E7|nr:uncharacterized protein LOC126906699 [Daktulosphaira vitifoliae]